MKIVCPECDEKMMDETIGWRCPKCKGFVSSLDGKFYPHVDGSFMPPMTNADRIRAMSDEELAEFLAEEQFRIANVVFQAVGYGLEKQAIYVRRLDWLQQPAEEDT